MRRGATNSQLFGYHTAPRGFYAPIINIAIKIRNPGVESRRKILTGQSDKANRLPDILRSSISNPESGIRNAESGIQQAAICP